MDNKQIIGERISRALEFRGVKQKELAERLKVKDNVVSYFCSGTRIPNTMQIIEIATFLNVSTDYLLGLSAIQSTDADIKAIHRHTGLSDKAIEELNKHINFGETASEVISSKEFFDICRNLERFSVVSEIALLKFPQYTTNEDIKLICSQLNVSEKYLDRFIDKKMHIRMPFMSKCDYEDIFVNSMFDFDTLRSTYRYTVCRLSDKICDVFDISNAHNYFDKYSKEELLKRLADFIQISVDELLNLAEKEAPDNGKHTET